jgi:hypothetical protein
MRATFIGSKPFPLEMLTEDECYPSTNLDTTRIIQSIRREDPPTTEYEITVTRAPRATERQWAVDKWRLLGYKLKKIYLS